MGKQDFREKVTADTDGEGEGGMATFRQGMDSMSTHGGNLSMVFSHAANIPAN